MLWLQGWTCVRELRPAFSREATFLWFCVALVAISVRNDYAGVTSYIRCLGLHKLGYTSLLNLFHSRAINLNKLTATWTSIVIKTCASPLYKVNGRIVCHRRWDQDRQGRP